VNVKREQAVVLGGSIAGLLAARVLTDSFERVILVERDHLPTDDAHRPGVPQARHVHGLLMRGMQVIERYYPTFQAELDAAGVPTMEWMRESIQWIPTGWTPRFASGIISRPSTRPLLEGILRRLTLAIPNLMVRAETTVTDLVFTADHKQVTGVIVTPRQGGTTEEISADLVVDATGRSSDAPQWLQSAGYELPTETVVSAGLGYASRLYAMPESFQPDWKSIMIMTTPERPRGGVFQLVEGRQWMLTLAGTAEDYPSTKEDALSAFAHSLPAPPLHEALAQAQPLTPIFGYRHTDNRLRHYEKLPAMPDGLIVTGDAVCAFNPVYGQGMTAAALGAEVLAGWLREGRASLVFQKRLAKSNQSPWLMATNEDYRYPIIAGDAAPEIVHRLNRYVDWLFAAAPDVPQITQTFLGVMHLVKPPTSLFNPTLIARRIWWGLHPPTPHN